MDYGQFPDNLPFNKSLMMHLDLLRLTTMKIIDMGKDGLREISGADKDFKPIFRFDAPRIPNLAEFQRTTLLKANPSMFRQVAKLTCRPRTPPGSRRKYTNGPDEDEQSAWIMTGGALGAIAGVITSVHSASDLRSSTRVKMGWLLFSAPICGGLGGLLGAFGGFALHGITRCKPCIVGAAIMASGVALLSIEDD